MQPFGQAGHAVFGLDEISMSAVFGGEALVATVAYVAALGTRRRSPRAAALGAMMVFLSAMALATAAGRLRFGLTAAMASRYATPMLPIWLCLAVAAMRQRSAVGPAIAGLILASAVVTEASFVAAALDAGSLRRGAIPALLAGVNDSATIGFLHPVPEAALHDAERLKDGHASLFADPWTAWMGKPLAAVAAILPSGACAGAMTKTRAGR